MKFNEVHSQGRSIKLCRHWLRCLAGRGWLLACLHVWPGGNVSTNRLFHYQSENGFCFSFLYALSSVGTISLFIDFFFFGGGVSFDAMPVNLAFAVLHLKIPLTEQFQF